METEKIIRLPEVKASTGLGRSTIYRRMATGDFPHSIPLGGDRVGWMESEIQAWIKDRVVQRDQ